MSRIHEALKRAEQERSAGQGGQPEVPVSASTAVAGDGLAAPLSPVIEHVPGMQAAMPAMGTPFTRCWPAARR